MYKNIEGQTLQKENIESEAKLSGTEKMNQFLRDIIHTLQHGKKLDITREELLDIINQTREKILSAYDYDDSGKERFRAEDFE